MSPRQRPDYRDHDEGARTVIPAEELTGAGSALAGFDLTFIPGDPPRSGRFAAFRLDGGNAADLRDDPLVGLGEHETIELALPAGKSVRRRRVAAVCLSIATALPLLLDLEDSQGSTATARIWASVMTAGIGLIARGRLRPAISPSGVDAWRAGPLDPGDRFLLEKLANVMPPLGHAVPLVSPRPPLRVHSPAFLVVAAWDALADTLPRTAAAPTASGSSLFAATQATLATELRPWLAEASAGLDSGATFALRVHLGDASVPEPRGVLQISSTSDPSLVVDAADLFTMPAALVARFGSEAERDLLLALRPALERGSRSRPFSASRSQTRCRLTMTCLRTFYLTAPVGSKVPACASFGRVSFSPAD